MSKMSDREVNLLYEAARMTGEDPSKLSLSNPFSKSGKKAEMIQLACAEIDPEQAAIWRVQQGREISVATARECRAGNGLSDQARADLWAHDPAFVRESIAERANEQQRYEDHFEKQYQELRLKNRLKACGGNEGVAKEQIRLEDHKNAEEARRKAIWAQGGMV